jgi:hypothetical protein
LGVSNIGIILKKKRKLRICVDFKILNLTTKKDLYMLPFTNEVINVIVGHKVYTFLDEFSRCHQISIPLNDQHKTAFMTDWGAFVWVVMPFGVKDRPPTYQRVVTGVFCEYINVFMNFFLMIL